MADPIIRPRLVLLATTNAGKIAELKTLLGSNDIEILCPRDVGLDLAVAETARSFAGNATLKAEAYSRAAGIAAIADDSGLAVDALGGRPGMYSARFGGPEADDARRIQLVLDELERLGASDRRARFIAVVALAIPGAATMTFEGRVDGSIAPEPRGNNGFGYDPIFLYQPAQATFAQMPAGEKGLVSHRARATARLRGFLRVTTEAAEEPYT